MTEPLSKTRPGPDEDEPLDPAMERVRRKMVRLLAVSIGVMIIGVFAVLAAVVWRVTSSDGPVVARDLTLSVPAGFEVQSASSGAGQLTLLGMIDGRQRLFVFDAQTGQLLVNAGINADQP